MDGYLGRRNGSLYSLMDTLLRSVHLAAPLQKRAREPLDRVMLLAHARTVRAPVEKQHGIAAQIGRLICGITYST